MNALFPRFMWSLGCQVTMPPIDVYALPFDDSRAPSRPNSPSRSGASGKSGFGVTRIVNPDELPPLLGSQVGELD
ncbi:hypothetical protein Nepgr_012477 [Nepenthes gracilis]|uniref:Uncharacterized protein n=1 Tax=Nepenthes gracilis TaxID=150966 RepID=A0AAD3XND4_NEPGR|nr:hypothetical protein Nepgr_012477 [Nepenthes gracilis]